jgi:hypothetical protein
MATDARGHQRTIHRSSEEGCESKSGRCHSLTRKRSELQTARWRQGMAWARPSHAGPPRANLFVLDRIRRCVAAPDIGLKELGKNVNVRGYLGFEVNITIGSSGGQLKWVRPRLMAVPVDK